MVGGNLSQTLLFPAAFNLSRPAHYMHHSASYAKPVLMLRSWSRQLDLSMVQTSELAQECKLPEKLITDVHIGHCLCITYVSYIVININDNNYARIFCKWNV